MSGFSTLFLCKSRMNVAILSSFLMSGMSFTGKIKSNRLMSVGGIFICVNIGSYGSNLDSFGFAAASTVVSQRRLAWMFALLIVTLCCSRASCIALISSLFILSSSSMQQTPRFARTSAPASRLHPCMNSSLTTVAVRPAPVAPLPDTYLDFGAICCVLLSICDFAAPGSPTSRMCMSPLVMTPSFRTFRTPPISCSATASLIFSCP